MDTGMIQYHPHVSLAAEPQNHVRAIIAYSQADRIGTTRRARRLRAKTVTTHSFPAYSAGNTWVFRSDGNRQNDIS